MKLQFCNAEFKATSSEGTRPIALESIVVIRGKQCISTFKFILPSIETNPMLRSLTTGLKQLSSLKQPTGLKQAAKFSQGQESQDTHSMV